MIPAPVRWALAAIAAAGAFFAGVYAYVLAILLPPFPPEVTDPAASFLVLSLVTLAGSITAPRRRFGTAEFRAEERGPDGEHYFLVHDTSRDRAFVWVKSNF